MAGKPKHGLDFYYRDVDELSDVKIRRLLKKYKSEGYSIYQVLKTLIYKEAHFLAFTDIIIWISNNKIVFKVNISNT